MDPHPFRIRFVNCTTHLLRISFPKPSGIDGFVVTVGHHTDGNIFCCRNPCISNHRADIPFIEFYPLCYQIRTAYGDGFVQDVVTFTHFLKCIIRIDHDLNCVLTCGRIPCSSNLFCLAGIKRDHLTVQQFSIPVPVYQKTVRWRSAVIRQGYHEFVAPCPYPRIIPGGITPVCDERAIAVIHQKSVVATNIGRYLNEMQTDEIDAGVGYGPCAAISLIKRMRCFDGMVLIPIIPDFNIAFGWFESMIRNGRINEDAVIVLRFVWVGRDGDRCRILRWGHVHSFVDDVVSLIKIPYTVECSHDRVVSCGRIPFRCYSGSLVHIKPEFATKENISALALIDLCDNRV